MSDDARPMQGDEFQSWLDDFRRNNSFLSLKSDIKDLLIDPSLSRQQCEALKSLQACNNLDEIRALCCEHLGLAQEAIELRQWLKIKPKESVLP